MGEVTVLVVCVCVCLSVTALAGAPRTLQPQVRYQQEALDARIETNVGISPSILSSRVMTDFSSPRTVWLGLAPQTRCLQGASAVRRRLVGQALRPGLATTACLAGRLTSHTLYLGMQLVGLYMCGIRTRTLRMYGTGPRQRT